MSLVLTDNSGMDTGIIMTVMSTVMDCKMVAGSGVSAGATFSVRSQVLKDVLTSYHITHQITPHHITYCMMLSNPACSFTPFSTAVHIGMCHPPPAGDYNKCPAPSSSSSSTNSHRHAHPQIMPRCDCPNCDAPGSHNFDFCTSGTSDSSSSSSNSDSSSSSTTQTSYYAGYGARSSGNNNGNTYANGGEDNQDGTSQKKRSKQSATSMFFNPMAYVIAGSAAVLLVGAVLVRKRVSLSSIVVERSRRISYRVDIGYG
jgi:hypothetical protein